MFSLQNWLIELKKCSIQSYLLDQWSALKDVVSLVTKIRSRIFLKNMHVAQLSQINKT